MVNRLLVKTIKPSSEGFFVAVFYDEYVCFKVTGFVIGRQEQIAMCE